MATATMLGAVSIQLKSLVAGNNPQDMSDPKFAGRAVVQGGALGLYGDTLVNLWASPYKEHITDQLGPMVGLGGDIYDLARAAWDKARDPNAKENVGGEAARILKGNTPGASLWYTKAALDHLIFQRLQDYYSPGYAQRLRDRTQKFYNSGQWWQPSTAASPGDILSGSGRGLTQPQQPNLNTALGGH
jgi:hypothetical protein